MFNKKLSDMEKWQLLANVLPREKFEAKIGDGPLTCDVTKVQMLT